MDRQQTLAGEASYQAPGLHSGRTARVRFLGAPEGTGVTFVRTDLPGKPKVRVAPVNAMYDAARGRRTILRDGTAEVHTVEHLLGAATGCGIDNLIVEVDGDEPGHTADGSALPFVEMFQDAGIAVQNQPRQYFEVPHPVRFARGRAELLGVPSANLRISFTIEYDNPFVGTQHAAFDIEPEVFVREIAPARTFVLRRDVEQLRAAGMIQGGTLDSALVVEEEGVANPDGMRFRDEFVRHKVLDFLGDLSLLGRPMRGHFLAWRSGHEGNVGFVQALAEAERKATGFDLPPWPKEGGPHWDIQAITEVMPHRYPFLLVDRIVELSDDHVIGIKNVTLNEPFFIGHFPGHPIMPAVLIVEAMAQTGGVLLLNKVERPKEKLVYFMGIDSARFRRPVRPGDQLRFELKLLKLKGRICKMEGKAYVDGNLVAEAELLSTVVDR